MSDLEWQIRLMYGQMSQLMAFLFVIITENTSISFSRLDIHDKAVFVGNRCFILVCNVLYMKTILFHNFY